MPTPDLTMDLLPEWQVAQWINSREPLTVASLRGKVVVIHAFQMLCPGCVAHGLPQAERIRQTFDPAQVAVVGLHTVFEHHDAMGAAALRAFVHEYRWSFPIGIDQPSDSGPVPRTMSGYGLRGTPTLIVLDRQGVVRLHHFGRIEDLALGALIGQLVGEPLPATTTPAVAAEGCNTDACAVTGGTF